MNTAVFLSNQQRYFAGAYEQFCAFGGPCVRFHLECLRAGEADFLSDRHVEMLYATLTAWGMHRMGPGNTRLTDWEIFSNSLRTHGAAIKEYRSASLLDLSEAEYGEALTALESCYRSLKLTVSGATVVVNSKALFHLLPDLIPPIDRQYTIRFFTRQPEQWRYPNGKFKAITLPANLDAQFDLFRSICFKVKRLADQVDRSFLDRELRENTVTAPKAIDNAIVNFVRRNDGNQVN